MRLFQKIKFYISEKKAITGAIIAIGGSMIAIIGTVAVEMNAHNQRRQEFKDAVDSALLGAVGKMRTDTRQNAIETETRRIFYKIYRDKNPDFILQKVNIQALPLGARKPTKWTVDAGGVYKTPMLGNSVTLSHAATAEINVPLEIVFVVDISTSMCMKRKSGTNITLVEDSSCAKLNTLKETLKYIINKQLLPFVKDDSRVKIGIVPYTDKVRYPNLSKIPDEIDGAELAYANDPDNDDKQRNYFTNFDTRDNLPELPVILPLQKFTDANRQEINNYIDTKLVQNYRNDGWTRTNIGMLAAALMLDPDKYDFYQDSSYGAERPVPFSTIKSSDVTQKHVILVTDGSNISCCFNEVNGDKNRQYYYLYFMDNAQLIGARKLSLATHGIIQRNSNVGYFNDWASTYWGQNSAEKGVCQQLQQKGAEVSVILFDMELNTSDQKEIYKKCATIEGGKSSYYEANAENGLSSELTLTLNSIISGFVRPRLVE